MSSTANAKALYENLDTSFVNLWSLLRNLTQRGFIGRVRVDLPDYYADVFLTGSTMPLVHEVDRAAGTDTLEEAALHRLVLRVRETPGAISVFEGAEEAIAIQNLPPPADLESAESKSIPSSAERKALNTHGPPPIEILTRGQTEPDVNAKSAAQRALTITTGGELVAAVERGINALGEDFNLLFNAVRLDLVGDYSYLDPQSNGLSYSNGQLSLNYDVTESVYVSGLSEALRRTVDRVAVGDRARRVRERIALELVSVARKRREALEYSGFGSQLDEIAGTKVI